MKVTIEDIGTCKKNLHIELVQDEITAELENTYNELAQSAQIPGFRKGHVPRKLLEKRFGKTVSEDVKEKLMSEFFQNAAKENDLTPMLDPEFENVEYKAGESLVFDAKVEVRPTFDLPEYKAIAIEKKKAAVSDAEANEAIENIRRSMGRFEIVSDRNAQEKDYLLGEAEIVEAGESAWKKEHCELILEGDLFLGMPAKKLVKELVGAKKDEVRAISVEIPDGFPVEQLRGKKSTVNFKVLEIREVILPDMNDDFAKQLGLKDMSEFKAMSEKRLAAEKESRVQKDLENQVLDHLIDASNIELSDKIIEMQSQVLLQKSVYNLARLGMTENQFGEKKELLTKESRKAAVRDLKLSFILDKIADAERIFVTEQEYGQHVAQMAASQGIKPQALYLRIEKEDSEKDIRYQLREQKTIQLLLEKAKISDVEKTIDEHEKELAEKRRKERETLEAEIAKESAAPVKAE